MFRLLALEVPLRLGPLLGRRLLGLSEVHRPADQREDGEHQEGREQEQGDRRDEARPLTVNVAAGQLARAPGEHRQRPPDLAFEMEHAVGEVVPECPERPVDVRALSAAMAIFAGQRAAAVEAGLFVRMTVAFARARLERTADDRAGSDIPDCVQIRHRPPPAGTLCGLALSC